MGTMLATLGFTPKKVTEPIPGQSNIDKIVVFHGKTEQCKVALDKVHEQVVGLEIDCVAAELPDSFDIVQVCKFMSDTIKDLEAKKEEIVSFNISGGTAVMNAAGILVAIVHGIPMVYVREDTKEPILLPLLKMDFKDVLTPKEHKLVKILRGTKGMTLKELAKKAAIDKSTMSQHIKRMMDKGLVSVDRGKDRREVVIKPTAITDLLVSVWKPSS